MKIGAVTASVIFSTHEGIEMKPLNTSRRAFLRNTGALTTSILLPRQTMACLRRIETPIKLGMIADLHQDVMHDGPARLQTFLDAMKEEKPDALLQLGDFAYPTKKNEVVTGAFEKAHPRTLHVLGNHEIDDGHSFDEVAKLWGMKGRYYTENVNGTDCPRWKRETSKPQGWLSRAHRGEAACVARETAENPQGADSRHLPPALGGAIKYR